MNERQNARWSDNFLSGIALAFSGLIPEPATPEIERAHFELDRRDLFTRAGEGIGRAVETVGHCMRVSIVALEEQEAP